MRKHGNATADPYVSDQPALTCVASAHLPLAISNNVHIHCFRARGERSTHLALCINLDNQHAQTHYPPPLVRVHSSCLTGDILGSLRCDCGDQLQQAIHTIAQAGGGILLYLHQEGRGIGIVNKIRAYRLQEQGLDTYEANQQLGFEDDERDFAIAASILKQLHTTHIRLLTNNPQKISKLEAHHIKVTQRIPLVTQPTAHNSDYLTAKRNKCGHLL